MNQRWRTIICITWYSQTGCFFQHMATVAWWSNMPIIESIPSQFLTASFCAWCSTWLHTVSAEQQNEQVFTSDVLKKKGRSVVWRMKFSQLVTSEQKIDLPTTISISKLQKVNWSNFIQLKILCIFFHMPYNSSKIKYWGETLNKRHDIDMNIEKIMQIS